MSRAGNRIKTALAEALEVAVMGVRIKPSCGCVFCDLKMPTYRDDHGFYHDGTRLACTAPIAETAYRRDEEHLR